MGVIMRHCVRYVVVSSMMVLHVLLVRWRIMKSFVINARDFHGLVLFVLIAHLLRQHHNVVIAQIMV